MAKTPSKGSGHSLAKIEVTLSLSPEQSDELLKTLHDRFDNNPDRHRGLEWSGIQEKLAARPEKLSSLYAMESTGGEPDVVGYDDKSGEFIFYDCSEQSPSGRRSICYDGEGEWERVEKGVHPAGNAVDLAAAMGIELLNEEQYRELQQMGDFDTKTESWLHTPASIRDLGGAIFGDRRFNHVFVFHNTAKSFYSSRGFRGSLRV